MSTAPSDNNLESAMSQISSLLQNDEMTSKLKDLLGNTQPQKPPENENATNNADGGLMDLLSKATSLLNNQNTQPAPAPASNDNLSALLNSLGGSAKPAASSGSSGLDISSILSALGSSGQAAAPSTGAASGQGLSSILGALGSGGGSGLSGLGSLLGGNGNGLSALTGLLGGGGGNALSGISGLLGGGSSSDPRDNLLMAIEPFLKPESKEKLSMARTLLKFAGVASLVQDINL